MKKIVLSISFILFIPLLCLAQKRFQYGFKIGEGIRSFQSGVFGELKIAGPLSMQAGMSFFSSTKKENLAVVDQDGWAIDESYALLRSYHAITPIQLKLSFGKKKVVPYLLTGIAPSFLLRSVAIPEDKSYDINFTNVEHNSSLYYLLSLGEEGRYNHQKRADISSVSPNYDTRMINSFGVDIRFKKITPFAELQVINSFKKYVFFQSQIKMLFTLGLKF